MNAENRRWISPREAAVYLGCHLQTVYGWIDSGKLVAARVGRRFVRVDLKALEAGLEKQGVGKKIK
jgi:excisionase family DNA binding protein